MHPSLPPKPKAGFQAQANTSRPQKLPMQHARAQEMYSQAPTSQPVFHAVGGPATYFSNAHGYQPIVHAASGQWHQQQDMAFSPPYMNMNGGYNMYHDMASSSRMSNPLVNPYAPQINYNILPLNSRGDPMVYAGDAGAPSSSAGTPGWNGAGTTGPVRCGHTGCVFRASHKDVEVHRMDRHLIYPPGWAEQQKKQKRVSDDDDLSEEQIAAKRAGATTIQGTTLVLDTPEAVQAWIAERKKRYPSAKRVEDKERALQEAKDRGQILPNEGQRKRKPFNEETSSGRGGGRGRGRGRGRGGSTRGRGSSNVWSTSQVDGKPTSSGDRLHHSDHPTSTSDRAQDGGWRSRAIRPAPPRAQNGLPAKPPPAKTVAVLEIAASDSDDESTSSGSGSDVDPVRDSVSSRLPAQAMNDVEMGIDEDEEDIDADGEPHMDEDADPETQSPAQNPTVKGNTTYTKPPLLQSLKRKPPPQPRRAPRGPFSNRPSLLRNLLLPDIRTTVSNLSQAIRFLVANDFLEGVELKPGQAANPLIEVVGETSAPVRSGDWAQGTKATSEGAITSIEMSKQHSAPPS